MVPGFRRLLKCRVERSMITARGMITGADSTLGVEASQETFPEQKLFQKCVKEL